MLTAFSPRLSPLQLALALALAGACLSVAAQPRDFDIAAQDLKTAVGRFETQSGLQVGADEALLQGRQSRPLQGRMEPLEALRQMFAGQGLRVEERDGRLRIEPQGGGDKTLSAVNVTARYSEERVKDLPFSVSVLSGEELESRRLANLEQVLRSSAGVDVNSWGGANDANIRIRGVGSLYQVSADDGSVVVNVDGVPFSARNASLATLDVERVEVLKGPQGTLFGRNSEAGAINVTTRRPTRETEGYLRGEVGQQGQHLEEFAVGGALGQQFSGRFALRNSGADNWVDNSRSGGPISKLEDRAYRGSLLWDLQPGTSALFIAERQKMQGRAGLMVLKPYGDKPVNDVAPGSLDGNYKTLERQSLEINHNLAGSRLTSVTSRTRSDLLSNAGADRTVAALWQGAADPVMKTETARETNLNQDLRLSSLPGANVFWVAGLNVLRADRTFDMDMPAYSYFGGPMHQDRTLNQRKFKTESEALYGEMTYPLTEALKLTAGLRHTWERKSFTGYYDKGASTFGGFPMTVRSITGDQRSLSENYSTGRLGLAYALTPATNVYAILARGYKAGGFNDNATQVADGTPYKAAVANSLELGFKSEAAERRFGLNGAFFLNRVKDDHLLSYDPGNNFASKAVNANTESKGFELEGSLKAGGGFTLSGGVAYLHSTIASDALGVDGGDVRSGNRLPDIPKWSWSGSLDYRQALASGLLGMASPVLNAKLTYRYMGKRPNDPQNHVLLDAYQKVDMRIGIMGAQTEVYLWGDNLLDERYDLYGYYMKSYVGQPDFVVGMPSRGRSFGIGASYFF